MELGRIGESCLFDTVRQLHNNSGKTKFIYLYTEVTKRVYFIGNERMLIAHDSNRLRFS